MHNHAILVQRNSMKPECPVCGSNDWFGYDRIEDGKNHRSRIEWRECTDCGCIFDEIEAIRWKKDNYGRLELVFKR